MCGCVQLALMRRAKEDSDVKFTKAMDQLIDAQTTHKKQARNNNTATLSLPTHASLPCHRAAACKLHGIQAARATSSAGVLGASTNVWAGWGGVEALAVP